MRKSGGLPAARDRQRDLYWVPCCRLGLKLGGIIDFDDRIDPSGLEESYAKSYAFYQVLYVLANGLAARDKCVPSFGSAFWALQLHLIENLTLRGTKPQGCARVEPQRERVPPHMHARRVDSGRLAIFAP